MRLLVHDVRSHTQGWTWKYGAELVAGKDDEHVFTLVGSDDRDEAVALLRKQVDRLNAAIEELLR